MTVTRGIESAAKPGAGGLRYRHSLGVWVTGGAVRYAVVASHGVWRSLVACFVRDEEVVGSNPATPTL